MITNIDWMLGESILRKYTQNCETFCHQIYIDNLLKFKYILYTQVSYKCPYTIQYTVFIQVFVVIIFKLYELSK